MRTDWLTGYGPSNLEALLILIVMVILLVVVWMGVRHRWRSEARRMESALADTGQLRDQLRGKLSETEQQRDQLRRELTASQQQGEQLKSALVETEQQRDHLQSELTAAQRQTEQLQREMNEVRAKYDPIRIRELQDEFHTDIAHKFAPDLDSFVQDCKRTVDKLTADQVDLRILQNALRVKADNMNQYCKNVVGLERLDRIRLTLQPVNLVGLLQTVVIDLEDTCAAFRGVRLELAPPPMLPKMWINKDLIGEVFRNIVRNAANASLSGDVVDITVRLDDGDPPQVIVDVHNNGKVIPPELQAQIFELHRRGVGLPYSRKVARLHRGDVILVWSKPGEGTLFRIILPYGEPPSPDSEAESTPPREQGDSTQPSNQDDASPPDATSEGVTP